MPFTSQRPSRQDGPEQQSARIAFVTSSLGFGGASTFLCNLGRALQEQEAEVRVFALERENAFASDFVDAGIVTIVQDERRFIFEDRLSRTLAELAAFQPTAVVANLGHSSYEVLRYVPEGVCRAGVIHADHEMFYGVAIQYAKYLDLVVGVSAQIERKLRSIEVLCHSKTHFLTSGVTVDTELPARNTAAVDPIRILYLGRLERGQKRVHLFPQILRCLQESGIPFAWTIVGEGAERQRLAERLISSNPQQTVKVEGPIPNSAVGKLLGEHDVLLLCSDCEGLPISLLEAMAHGVVPVVTRLDSGIDDLVDVTSGCQVDADDTDGYARAIVNLHNDRATLARLSRNAHHAVLERYSSGTMAEKWVTTLRTREAPPRWSANPSIVPPIFATNQWYYTRIVRVLRRILKRHQIGD